MMTTFLQKKANRTLNLNMKTLKIEFKTWKLKALIQGNDEVDEGFGRHVTV